MPNWEPKLRTKSNTAKPTHSKAGCEKPKTKLDRVRDSRQALEKEENPVADESDQPQQEPGPQEEPLARPEPALTPLMQRVMEARDANDIPALRRLRWCFHEAAHAIVAHCYGATVSRIVINTTGEGRPFASIDGRLLDAVLDAVKAHGAGSSQALAAIVPFFAQYTSGELIEQEVQITQPIISKRVDELGWDTVWEEPMKFDSRMIITAGRAAGFKNRTDLVEAGEGKATEIIVAKRSSFEALATYIHDVGNIEGQTLQDILDK
jgi:hypothetical protein